MKKVLMSIAALLFATWSGHADAQVTCGPGGLNTTGYDAEIISVEVPTVALKSSGTSIQRIPVKVRVRNTGKDWNTSTKLAISALRPPDGSFGFEDGFQPWVGSVWRLPHENLTYPKFVEPVGATVAGQQDYTFEFDMAADQSGRHVLSFQMALGSYGDGGLCPFGSAETGSVYVDPTSTPLAGGKSKFISATVPGVMVKDEKYRVRVKFRNLGALEWANDGTTSTNFKLAFDAPHSGTTCPQTDDVWRMDSQRAWRIDDLQLLTMSPGFVPPSNPGAAPFDDSVAVFEFEIQAPSEAGVYPLGFRMFRGGCGAGVTYFGEASPYKTIRVVDAGTEFAGLPNIVHIVLDDLDYCDFSAVGNRTPMLGDAVISTPEIDEIFFDDPATQDLRSDAVSFERYYANGNVCSPTRTSLMTGRSPVQYGVKRSIDRKGLAEDVPYQPELFKELGYVTGHFGKWHIGHSREEHRPTSNGIDESLVFYAGAENYSNYTLYENDLSFCRPFTGNTCVQNELGYLDETISLAAIDFIKNPPINLTNQPIEGHPFFLNVWFHTPHASTNPGPSYVCAPDHVGCDPASTTSWERYAGMVSYVDTLIHDIYTTLVTERLLENTIFIVSSDNGGEKVPNDGGPRRSSCGDDFNPDGVKADFFERGIRVPLLMRYPGFSSNVGSTDQLAFSADLLPTLLELAGEDPDDYDFAGESLHDLLVSNTSFNRDGVNFYWEGKESKSPQTLGYSADRCRIRNNYAVLKLSSNPAESLKLLRNGASQAEENLFLFDLAGPGIAEDPDNHELDLISTFEGREEALEMQEAYFQWREDTARIPLEVASDDGVVWDLDPPSGVNTVDFPFDVGDPGAGHSARLVLQERFEHDVHRGDYTFRAKVDLKADAINTGGIIAQKKCSWDLAVLGGGNLNRVQLRVWDQDEGCPGDPTQDPPPNDAIEPAVKITSTTILSSVPGEVHDVAFTLYGYPNANAEAILYVDDEVLEASPLADEYGTRFDVKLSDFPVALGNNDALTRPFLGSLEDVELFTVALYDNQLPGLSVTPEACLPLP